MNDSHFLIDSIGPDVNGARKAIAWLLTQEGKIGYLAVMSKASFKEAEIYKEVLGLNIVKELVKNSETDFLGMKLVLLYRPHKMYFKSEFPVVVFYPNKVFLDEIESYKPQKILVVQWAENEMFYWKEKNNPIFL